MSFLAYALLAAMLLHPAQESLGELHFNEKTQRVEVALRLSLADEQRLLRTVSHSPFDDLIQNDDALAQAALDVLCERVRFGTKSAVTLTKPSAKSVKAYHWVGRQSEGGHVWWYFAYVGTPEQITHIRCTLFAASGRTSGSGRSANDHDHLHADPVSTFVVLHPNEPSEPKSFTTTREKPVHRIEW